MQRLKRDPRFSGDPASARVRNCSLSAHKPHHLHFAHILEADPALFDYLTHPRLVGMAEELVGGDVRLEESEAVINTRAPDTDVSAPPRYGFHVGTWPDVGTYTANDLYHCTFVKTLTNLTELGPDDGGTVCIAGSHKVGGPREAIIEAAQADPSLIHQVIAPAGSTLLFGEALIHATGQIRSDRERCIVIGGYTPTMFQAWNGQEPSAEFVEQTPDHLKPLISAATGGAGSSAAARWLRPPRIRHEYRRLFRLAGGRHAGRNQRNPRHTGPASTAARRTARGRASVTTRPPPSACCAIKNASS